MKVEYVSALQFSKDAGLPYNFILQLCKENRIPRLVNGNRFTIPKEDALEYLKELAAPIPKDSREEQRHDYTETPARNIRRAVRAKISNPQTSADLDFESELNALLGRT